MQQSATDPSQAGELGWLARAFGQRKVIFCRLLAGAWIMLVMILAFTIPHPREQLNAPDPWAYIFATENFARGRWVISDQEMAAGRMQIRLRGGHLTQYVNMGPDRWALEKAPGFPMLAALFQRLGLPPLTNAVLAVIAAVTIYVLVAHWLDEGLACAAVALLLLTPMSLAAQGNVWMDTFASGVIPLIGGAFYFLYLLHAKGRAGLALIFVSGIWLGWASVVRLSNVLFVALCGLHLLMTTWRTRPRLPGLFAMAAFALGTLLTLGGLALYNRTVFGSIFDTGYAHSLYRISFALGGAIGKPGVPVSAVSFSSGIQMLGQNLVRVVQPWLIGFPLLILALLGWVVFSRQNVGRFSRWLLMLWGLAAALPYISFTWLDALLTQPANRYERFFEIDRYFFPWIFPLTLLAVVALARLPRRVAWGLALLYVAGSIWFYIHSNARI